MSMIAWIVFGLIAGFIGSKIVNKTGEGVLLDIVLGTHAGVPEEHAHIYAVGVRRGGSLVTAKMDEALVPTARTILSDSRTVDVQARGRAYREQGWTRFDQTAPAYTADQVNAERARFERV